MIRNMVMHGSLLLHLLRTTLRWLFLSRDYRMCITIEYMRRSLQHSLRTGGVAWILAMK